MNLQLNFLDCNSNVISGSRFLFTPINIPSISASYLSTADSYSFYTDKSGSISASIFPGAYTVSQPEPGPLNTFYVTSSLVLSSVYTSRFFVKRSMIKFNLFSLLCYKYSYPIKEILENTNLHLTTLRKLL